jgi:large subunit ribosomal protein L3
MESEQDYLTERFKVGQTLDVRLFSVGQTVSVKGTPVGKGFMGNQKRHNFSRGPMTHGSKNHRRPGSLGASSTPSRVYPGKKMAGRSCTTVNVYSKVLFIDKENNVLLLRGSLPGSSRTHLKIEKRLS